MRSRLAICGCNVAVNVKYILKKCERCFPRRSIYYHFDERAGPATDEQFQDVGSRSTSNFKAHGQGDGRLRDDYMTAPQLAACTIKGGQPYASGSDRPHVCATAWCVGRPFGRPGEISHALISTVRRLKIRVALMTALPSHYTTSCVPTACLPSSGDHSRLRGSSISAALRLILKLKLNMRRSLNTPIAESRGSSNAGSFKVAFRAAL